MELLILVIAEKPDLGKAIAAATPGGGTYIGKEQIIKTCLLYTSPSPRD